METYLILGGVILIFIGIIFSRYKKMTFVEYSKKFDDL